MKRNDEVIVWYEVRKFEESEGLPRWRASAYPTVLGKFRTLKAAQKLAARVGGDAWVCAKLKDEIC